MLETERLVLRKPALEDVDELMMMFGDPEVMRWIGGSVGDRAFAVESVDRWLRHWDENGVGHFVVLRDGAIIGRVGFVVWDGSTWEYSTYAAAGDEAVTELGWALASQCWGHGYATEAARAARNWGYAHGVPSLVSLIAPENERSISVARKLGAVPGETVGVHGKDAVVWQHL